MTYNELWHRLAHVYDEGEAKAIARMVYEVRHGLSLSDLYIGKDTQLSANDQAELEEIACRLERQEPVQYVLGQEEFCGRTFLVDESVLIPRPETAALMEWILPTLTANRSMRTSPALLDIGTGSGCIAITLAAELPEAQVTAWDISEEALKIARENAHRHHVHVHFEQVDILHLPSTIIRQPSSIYDLIVSNPPYICNKERAKMELNVLDYEPLIALFVPDEDPLLFYRVIAQYGQTALQKGGWLYFEINPLYATDLSDLLCVMSYHDIEINTDPFGKQRYIRAQR